MSIYVVEMRMHDGDQWTPVLNVRGTFKNKDAVDKLPYRIKVMPEYQWRVREYRRVEY